MLPSSAWSFVWKYPTEFPLLLMFNIHSYWMQIPINTCTERLRKRDVKDWINSNITSTQLVNQRSNTLYNRKGTYKARYQLPVADYIQMFH